MEEEGCCYCGGEAGLHRPKAFQFLRQTETRPRRTAQFFVVALLLLISVALALLIVITVVLGGRDHQSPDSQLLTQSERLSSGDRQQQPKDFKNPSAMLTAPKGNNTVGEYLAWESDEGNAFCHGGFSYSSGNLVVPRKGIYRVFLQITYEGAGLSDELRLSNTVFVIGDNYKNNVPLLSSVETVSCSMKQWRKSLYTAGLFSLEANSRLRVTSLYPELIVLEKESQVFFGADLVS